MLVTPPKKYIVAAKDHGNWDGLQPKVDERLIKFIKEFHYLATKRYGGKSGKIYATSTYRPKGMAASGDPNGSIDLSDNNGHYTGRAIDLTTDWTRNSYWPDGPDWHKDALRRIMYEAGFMLPWYKSGEFWHFSVEIEKWSQSNAYREEPYAWNGRYVPDDWQKQLREYNQSSVKKWFVNNFTSKKDNYGETGQKKNN